MTARHASLTQRGRGPCARVPCGHAEFPDHAIGFDGRRTYCALCGPEQCGSYRAPGRRHCARCGVRQNVHASFDGRVDAADLVGAINVGICPWWVRPSPLASLLHTTGQALRVAAWAVGIRRSR